MRRFLLSTLLLFVPCVAFASVEFVHIEFNPDGVDAKREWVRVKNAGESSIDLSGWKFFESGASHRLAPVSGTAVPRGGTAVIADDAKTFLAEYPESTDIIFDSSFSLTNSGETLELHDQNGTPVARATYEGAKKKTSTTPRLITKRATIEPVVEPYPIATLWWYLALAPLAALSGYAIMLLRSERSDRAPISEYRIVAVERERK